MIFCLGGYKYEAKEENGWRINIYELCRSDPGDRALDFDDLNQQVTK